MPRFAIAMPAYNAAPLVGRALESVRAQTFSDWEVIVVDDGSVDDTARVVRALAEHDPRIRLVQQANAGCGGARDSAVRASHAPWIVRLDADDELLPEYLEVMAAFIDAHPDHDIYSCNGWHVYPDGSRRLARPGEFYESERSFTVEDMFTATHIFTVAVFSRALFDRIGGIRTDVYCEDLDFWLRALSVGGARHLYTPQPLAIYHVSDEQMTADVSRVCASRAGIYQDLIDGGSLAPAQIELARTAIERAHQDAWIFARRSAVKDAVARMFGERAGERASAAMHASARVLRRPVARAVSFARRIGGSR